MAGIYERGVRECRCGMEIGADVQEMIAHVTSPEHETRMASVSPHPIDDLRNALTGLRVIGRTADGWLVRHKLTDRKLEPLETMGYRLIPSGPKHTVVALPRDVESAR